MYLIYSWLHDGFANDEVYSPILVSVEAHTHITTSECVQEANK